MLKRGLIFPSFHHLDLLPAMKEDWEEALPFQKLDNFSVQLRQFERRARL